MVGGDGRCLFMSGGDEGASGEVVCFSEQAAGSLVDGGDGGFVEERCFDAGDVQVVIQVSFHSLAIDAYEMSFGYYSRGKGH